MQFVVVVVVVAVVVVVVVVVAAAAAAVVALLGGLRNHGLSQRGEARWLAGERASGKEGARARLKPALER